MSGLPDRATTALNNEETSAVPCADCTAASTSEDAAEQADADDASEPKWASDADGQESVLQILWASGIIRLFPMLFLYIAGFGIILPFVPNLMTDFFASREAGVPIHCEDFSPLDKPEACRGASDAVVWWSSMTSFITNTVLAFAISTMAGAWSDSVGRKPFLVLSQLLSFGSKFVLLLYFTSGVSLIWYYPCDIMNGVISPITVSLAVVADMLPPRHRSIGFGLVLGAFAAGIAATPRIGGMLGPYRAVFWGVMLKVSALVYTLGLAALPWRAYATFMNWTPIRSMSQGLAIIKRYPEFMKLTACLMIAAFIQNGMSEVDNQFLISVLNFKPLDFSNVYIIFGVGSLTVQVLLMGPMIMRFGERTCLIVAYTAVIAKGLGFMLATSRAQVFTILAIYTLGMMAFPSISSIKANHVGAHEQGAVQGALSGASSLASGLGPLFFSAVWHMLANPASGAVPAPRVVMGIQAVLSAIPVLIIATLDMKQLTIRHEELLASASVPSSPRLGALDEPLLSEPFLQPTFGSMSQPSGHDVLMEEGAFVHREGDVSGGMWLEGDLKHKLGYGGSSSGGNVHR